ncbi:SDR family oxidoreductase [Peristeroidobacter soli]|uniref:SDR family oxidoreductase n=1 Tax=Peristeroidobacter soli TaxID=2497877 RepID=UPI00101C4B7F|nr:SDR family oxidoreductase [Peristeroidobacter soli]
MAHCLIDRHTLGPGPEHQRVNAGTSARPGEQARAIVSRYVIRRFGKPEDVAVMALFLCSDAAGWITGQTYPVNGGYDFAI